MQGIFISGESIQDNGYSAGGNGALAFDAEYARWLDKHQLKISDLRSALNSQLGNEDLRVLVNALMSCYDELFRLKNIGIKSDVFHMHSGMWTTPAERCFIWMGGFRSSEILKILAGHLEPLTDHQLMGICNLQQSSQEAEEALSQGMEALQQSSADSLVAAAPKHSVSSDNVANYMNQMTISMGKLTTLENFLRQGLMNPIYSQPFAQYNPQPINMQQQPQQQQQNQSVPNQRVNYWGKKLGKRSLIAYQASSRGGKLELQYEEESNRVQINGEATTIMMGTLLV